MKNMEAKVNLLQLFCFEYTNKTYNQYQTETKKETNKAIFKY